MIMVTGGAMVGENRLSWLDGVNLPYWPGSDSAAGEPWYTARYSPPSRPSLGLTSRFVSVPSGNDFSNTPCRSGSTSIRRNASMLRFDQSSV